uniref:Uncharacterized protein n=1 Tax=Eutreptiella gymnastica TaxID=73025 RepID=A0A7S1IA11_9EUGL|mmetsp:Transcript_141897/g.247352  ORF Transcript_141897/g.247352 Transcript_141897/m.247352 type:complete len:320 (+) Transcript_141897:3-962(+)
MFSFCIPTPDLKCRSEGLIVLVNGVTGAGKSSFCFHTRTVYPIVMTLSHDDHQLPNGDKLDGLTSVDLHNKLWSKAREYGQYGRTVLVEFNESSPHVIAPLFKDALSPHCLLMVYCNLQDLPKRLEKCSTCHQDLCLNIFKALQDFGRYFTGDSKKYPESALQYLKRSQVESTIEQCFKLIMTNTLRDRDMKTGLGILKDYLLACLHLQEEGASGVYVYPRQPIDVVLNSSQGAPDDLVKNFVPAIGPVRVKGFQSVLAQAQDAPFEEPFSCGRCGAPDFDILRLPCPTCFKELAARMTEYDRMHPPQERRGHIAFGRV